MKKNKMFRSLISSLIAVVLLMGLFLPVYAKEEADYTKSITFLTDNKAEKKDENFEKKIKVDGKNYNLQSINYDVVKTNPKPEKTVESDPVREGQDYSPEKEIIVDGITFKLKSSLSHETIIEEEVIQKVTGYTDYDYAVTSADVPITKEFSVKNDRTGDIEIVQCQLQNITALDGTWIDTYIDIVFETYDAEMFSWNGVQVKKNTNAPLAGYEKQLLTSVGADTENYKVGRTYWTSEPYTDSNGILCRNARADVKRYVTYYRASYNGEIKSGAVQGRYFTNIYEYESGEGDHYEIEATANYEEVKETPMLVIGIGVLILICLIVFILFVISKRNKKEKREEE